MNKSSCFLLSVERVVRHTFSKKASKIYANSCYFQRYISSNIINRSSPKQVTIVASATHDRVLTLNNPILEKYLNEMCNEASSKENNKQNNDLYLIIPLWKERQNLFQDLSSLAELQEDKELEALANDEMHELNEKIMELDEQIVSLLVPSDCPDVDPNSLVLEVSAGVGGQEAMLFAAELLDMYQGYVQFKGWHQDKAELDHSELGGLRHGSISINGSRAFLELQHEGGVHRVQRVPKTEKSGRLHTSTVTVAILPQPSEVAIVLHSKDLKVETKRSSGAGGQHVNTTDSCVRMTHIPSGLTVECQTERSQVQNRAKALQRLRARLYQRQIEQQESQRRDTRKQQVGLSLRSEKIRTYNFPQDRITDHRIGATLHNLKGFLDGGEVLEDLLQNLEKHENSLRLQALIASLQC